MMVRGHAPRHARKAQVDPFPEEWWKTIAAVVYSLASQLITSIMTSFVVHECMPAKEDTPPLPDKFFNQFDRREWAFQVCEGILILLAFLWMMCLSILKHRSIVGRRFCFLLGTLFLYRCVTMYITTLPVPGMHIDCAPKASGDYVMMAWRAMKLMLGFGLTITGSHQLCGDYLYSGHTVFITLTTLFLTEYSPKLNYNRLLWTLWFVGLVCILLAHDHYSIDVLVAYYVTTRLFWWYHTMANVQLSTRVQDVRQTPVNNFMSRVWWYRFFMYLESGVGGMVPCDYEVPLWMQDKIYNAYYWFSRETKTEWIWTWSR